MKRNAPLNMIIQRGGVIFLLMILLSCNSGLDSHTVTFNLDGGYFPEGYETTITIMEGSTLEGIPDPKKDSTYSYRYTFAGWYTDESFTDEYDTALPVTSDLTLYAKWNRYSISHTKMYTVSFQSNEGTEVASQSVVNGNMAEKPEDPEKEGYFFDGWYSDADTSIPYDFDTPVTSSITLYAKWAKAWTVTFSLDGLHEKVKGIANLETDKIYVKDGSTITFPKITIGGNPLSNIKFKDTSTGNEINSDSLISNDIALTAFIDDYAIAGNTYYVTSPEGLNAWATAVTTVTSYDCELLGNIRLSTVAKGESNWTPVSSYTGTFDGGGYTITGLIVTGSNEYAGLFGRIGSGGTVKNVVLKDVQIESDNQYGCVGGVAGNSDGNIENCSVSGSVSGRHTAGGVVGQQYSGFITMCGSSVTVNGTAEVGGVAGKTDNGATLTACYATGNVTFERASTINTFAGGVVGSNGSGSILSACYATGNVTGTGEGTGSIYVGGVTGDNASGTLTACYHATGTVNGPDGATGGVTGRNYTSLGAPVITACYWGNNNQEQGIGYNQAGNGDTKKVEDLTTWEDALSKMNAELEKQKVSYKYADNPDDASKAPLILIDSTSLP